jgi:hypothetical protein
MCRCCLGRGVILLIGDRRLGVDGWFGGVEVRR